MLRRREPLFPQVATRGGKGSLMDKQARWEGSPLTAPPCRFREIQIMALCIAEIPGYLLGDLG